MNERERATGTPHALVVGGSGMLRGVSLHLAQRGYAVSVVGRRVDRLQAVADAAAGGPGSVVPISVDYGETDRFREALLKAAEERGPVTMTVCWIHSTAPEVPFIVADVVAADAAQSVPSRYFHVRGSAGADPTGDGDSLHPDRPAGQRFSQYPGLLYRQVILGFVVNDGSSRWLTNEEISDGVISAIDQDADYTIVGTVEPWSMRPGG